MSERAETYLRLLAEEALRPARQGPAGPSPGTPATAGVQHPAREPPRSRDRAQRADRVARAADVLVDAGVLDDAQATEILLMLATALRLRGLRAPLAPARIRRLRGPAIQKDPPGPKQPDDTWRVLAAVPDQERGWRLMALIVTADRVIAPATLRFPPSAGLDDLALPSFADLSATDDAGTDYMISFAEGAWAGSTWTGTMLLRPVPPPHATTLSILNQNAPFLTLRLSAPPGSTLVEAPVHPVDDSPGERLLHRRAEALLGTLAGLPHDPFPGAPAGEGRRQAIAEVVRSLSTSGPAVPGLTPGFAPGPPPGAIVARGGLDRESDLAELVATLEGAGILSPLSEVPSAVAALCHALGIHGFAPVSGPASAGPAPATQARLPVRWAEVLAYYGRRRHQPPPPTAIGSIGAVLPEVDRTRFVVAGARTGAQGTVLHVVGRGPRTVIQAGQDQGFSWWARDESGGWHLGIVAGWYLTQDTTALRLTVIPPLRPGDPGTASTLTVEVTGSTQRVTVHLRVRW